jgi:leucyl-tRNA synthetase
MTDEGLRKLSTLSENEIMKPAPPPTVMRCLAKKQRTEPSRAEALLWTILRDRRIKAKFRRQMPVGPYIVDFICLRQRMIVEVDGPHHDEPEQKTRDAHRELWLKSEAFRVLRLSSEEVLGDPELATRKIMAALLLPVPKRKI